MYKGNQEAREMRINLYRICTLIGGIDTSPAVQEEEETTEAKNFDAVNKVNYHLRGISEAPSDITKHRSGILQHTSL